ncbi:MAG: hypothetical protein AB7G93_11975 [Bdellovibrionales bacterium]
MKARNLAVILLGVIAAGFSAFADPNVNKAIAQDCDPIYEGPVAGLFHLANIGPNDGRGGLLAKQKEFNDPKNKHRYPIKLTDADVDQIRKATGFFACGSRQNGSRGTGSGAIVGSSVVVPNVSHAVLYCNSPKPGQNGETIELANDDTNLNNCDDRDVALREPLEECKFQNQEVEWQNRKFEIDRRNLNATLRLGTRNPYRPGDKYRHRDFATVKLESPIPGVKPFPIEPKGTLLRVGQPVIQVSAYQDRMKVQVPRTEPIVEQCRITEVRPGNGVRGTVIVTDCSSAKGASGGVVLTKDLSDNSEGELIALATVFAGGSKEKDGIPYAPGNGSGTTAVAFEGEFLSHIVELSGSQGVETVIAEDQPQRPLLRPASFRDL